MLKGRIKCQLEQLQNVNDDVLLVLNLKETFHICNLETFRSDAHVIGRAQFYVMTPGAATGIITLLPPRKANVKLY